jgi:hypothetical protein
MPVKQLTKQKISHGIKQLTKQKISHGNIITMPTTYRYKIAHM